MPQMTATQLREQAEYWFAQAGTQVDNTGGHYSDVAVARTSIGMGYAYLWEIQCRIDGLIDNES